MKESGIWQRRRRSKRAINREKVRRGWRMEARSVDERREVVARKKVEERSWRVSRKPTGW